MARNANSENSRRFQGVKKRSKMAGLGESEEQAPKKCLKFDENHPMQLVFSCSSIINRLASKQNVLGQGCLINQAKLDVQMGEAFEESKKFHSQLQAKQMIELENCEHKLMTSNRNREQIRQQVVESLRRPHQFESNQRKDQSSNNKSNNFLSIGQAFSNIKKDRM